MKKLLLSAAALATLGMGSQAVYAGSHADKSGDAHHAEMKHSDIVDTAAANEDFSTLVAAVKAADLVDALKGDGPFTVFAPTNEAFAALPAGALDDLLKPENKEKLQALLKYHVVSGKILAGDIADGSTDVETLQGTTLTVTKSVDGVTVDGAKVTTADLKTSNGVIHVIDTVVMPK
ncbi:MAG: fasciclin domain-containing protein [Alphaproteobacteria bacterium]|nr:fasciclin domain-containing protein [Alphaproteobacteria bacterium]